MNDLHAMSDYSQLLERYTDQESYLPTEYKNYCKQHYSSSEIELYACFDLDASLNLVKQWLVLTDKELLIFYHQSDGSFKPVVLTRGDIKEVIISQGLSCTKSVYDTNSGSYSIYYSHRQRDMLAAINYSIKNSTQTSAINPAGADLKYTRLISAPIRKAQASVSPSQLTVVWRLLSYLRPYRKSLILGMSGAVVLTLMMLVAPFLTKYLIDSVYYPYQNGSLSYEQAMSIGTIVIVVLLVVYILRELGHWLRQRTMSVLGEWVAHDIRKELFEHMQKLNISFFSKNQTGSLISRVSSDTDRLWDFLAFGIVEVTLSVILLIGLSIVLIVLDWRLGLLVVGPIPIFLWFFSEHSKILSKLFTRAWRKWSRITEVLSDTIPGMRVVKAFNQEAREKKRFDDRNLDCVIEFNQIHNIWTRFWPRILLALHILVVVVWATALPRLIQNESSAVTPLSIGTFMAFVLYLNMFFYPMEVIGMVMRMLNRATSSANRVFEILDTEPDIKTKANPVQLNNISGAVRFEKVTFAYNNIKPVISDVSFQVEPGEMVGLVGQSGSGKSTLMNLLARFYLPSSGRIFVDNVDLRDLDIGKLRRQMGMVLQEPFLFHGSVLENIRYGNPDKSLDHVIEAAIAANAHDFICRLDYGYDTIVGERGHTLSGGERQRISIARAVLNNPKILILDEATSSVDTATERKIQEALDKLVENRTVFAIAHRLSTLRKANRILVLEKGQLIEQGTHEQLLADTHGIYSRLVQLQYS